MKININQEIKVKLTQEGQNILKQHNNICYPNPDKNGQITIQLWIFMSMGLNSTTAPN